MICVPENRETFLGQIFHQFNLNKKELNNSGVEINRERIEDKESFNLAVIRLMSSEIEEL